MQSLQSNVEIIYVCGYLIGIKDRRAFDLYAVAEQQQSFGLFGQHNSGVGEV